MDVPIPVHGFDSKLVRLKDIAKAASGAMAARFDSKLVRLKGHQPKCYARRHQVSIPNWFD